VSSCIRHVKEHVRLLRRESKGASLELVVDVERIDMQLFLKYNWEGLVVYGAT
jgi:hypothetical protein